MSETDNPRSLRRATNLVDLGEGRYRAEISQHYTVVGHPNGGYLQCLLANAALLGARDAGSSHRHATAITTNYVGSPSVGPAEVTVDVRRVGRGVSFAHVELFDNGKLTTESVVTLGTLAESASPRYAQFSPVELPPLDECLEHVLPGEDNIARCMELRLDPSCAGWWQGTVNEIGETRGWLRLNDGSASWDPWSLLFASDAMPPATFPLGSSGWVPTLQLSSYVRSIPVGQWLRARQWCVVVEGDLVDERCELVDERGRLVASSSQLAMVRFPPEP